MPTNKAERRRTALPLTYSSNLNGREVKAAKTIVQVFGPEILRRLEARRQARSAS